MRSETVAVGCHRLPIGLFQPFLALSLCDRLPLVAPAWLFLKKGRVSSHRCSFASSRAPERSGSSLSWRWTHTVSVGAVSASQFHKGPSGGQSQAGACRDRGGVGSWRGFEGFVAGEHVPGGDQDLARDRGFRGVVVARAAADVEVELVPGFDSRQACWAASTAAQPSSREPDLFSGPVCGRPSPDWRTRGASRP